MNPYLGLSIAAILFICAVAGIIFLVNWLDPRGPDDWSET
jgi:hypothetical protein